MSWWAGFAAILNRDYGITKPWLWHGLIRGPEGYSRGVATTDRIPDDYRGLTEAGGLLDRSERGKLALTGRGAKEFLDGQVTNAVEDLEPGQGAYAAFLTPKGKML